MPAHPETATSVRWSCGLAGFIVAAALINTGLYHAPLYAFAVASLDLASFTGALTLATLFFLATFATILVLSLLSLASPRLVKPFCMVAAPCNAIALYFVETYGVVLDKTMMGNVFNTNVAEASELFHPKALVYLLVLGVLPCLLLSRVKVRDAPLARRVALLLGSVLVVIVWMYASSKSWLWIDKNSRRLGGMTLPWSYVINAPRHLATLVKPREQALLPAATFGSAEKTVVFLVIGEAARAQNFSLYGYARPTNPLLARAGAVALPHARACATYTTAALVCILSAGDAGGPFSGAQEPLPSYLQRHGVDVIWRTHNWGEPPLKVATFERAEDLRHECQGDDCDHDEILLQGLEQRIRASGAARIFVVLHQRGSHGPAYYGEYPERFEVFKPVCKSVDLGRCSNEELVNAYDNTILYTDDFLSRAIGLLKDLAPAATMLMYLSDHGESLGEHGLYLHGTPYSFAPDVQKDIPFVIWMSEAFRRRKAIAPGHLDPQAGHSDDDVFHSVMGAFDMRSPVYRRELDIFAADAN